MSVILSVPQQVIWRKPALPRAILPNRRLSYGPGCILLPFREGTGAAASTTNRINTGGNGLGNHQWVVADRGLVYRNNPSFGMHIDWSGSLVGPGIFTAAFLCRPDVAGGITGNIYGEGATAGTGSRIKLDAGTSGQLQFVNVDSSGNNATSTGTGTNFHDGNWHAVMIRQAALNVHDLWLDGVRIGNATTTLTTAGRSATANTAIGAEYVNGGAGGAWRGDYLLAAFWPGRALSEAEIRHWSRNPLGLLVIPRRRFAQAAPTFLFSGVVSAYADADGAGLEVRIFRASDNAYLGSVTTTAGGAYSYQHTNDTDLLYAVCLEDATHTGASTTGTAQAA